LAQAPIQEGTEKLSSQDKSCFSATFKNTKINASSLY
jgi:hypothetical protein